MTPLRRIGPTVLLLLLMAAGSAVGTPNGLSGIPASAQSDRASGCGNGKVGVVEKVEGRLQVRGADRKWKTARANDTVKAKNQLRTGKSDRVAIRLCTGGHLYINQSTTVTLPDSRSSTLTSGELVAAAPAGKGEKVAAAGLKVTPAAQVNSNVDIQRKRGQVTVTTVEGSERVSNKHGAVTVDAGRQTVVADNRAPAQPAVADTGALTRWANGFSWSVLSRAGQLHDAEHIAVDSQGNIYVADTGNYRIVKISPAGQQLASWGSQGDGPGQFNQPTGVAVDAAGNVYVTDQSQITQGQIAKLSPSGQEIARFQPFGDLQFPEAIAVDGQGNMYVADSYLYRAGIYKLSPSGALLGHWGLSGPTGVALDRAGNVYAADGDLGRSVWQVIELAPDGAPVASWGGPEGTKPGEFASETAVAVDAQGNVYVADTNNNRVQELSPDGKVLAVWGGASGIGPGQFDHPKGIALDAQGNVYVVDTGNNRVQKYSRGG